MKLKTRVTGIKKGDRFWNEYWSCEVTATTDAYRLDGTVDPEHYHATRPKPKVAQCHWNGSEYVRDWWIIEVGVRNDGHGSGGWSEVEHRSIEVDRPIACEHCRKGPHDDGFPPIYEASEAIDLGWSRTETGLLDEECASEIVSNDYPREGLY